jgi:hypothetical protein
MISILMLGLTLTPNEIVAQTLTVGSGTGSSTNIPLNTYYGYNNSQTIYLSSDLTAAGASGPTYIKSISYYYFAASNPTTNWDTWDIYMKNSTKSVFTDVTNWETGLTKVFSGSVTIPNTGGQLITITLNTPFLWDGTSNLIVGLNENKPNYSSPSAAFNITTFGNSTDYRTLLYNEYGQNPDPSNPPAATYLENSFANVQFETIPYSICSGTPAIANAISSTTINCENAPFTLNLKNNSIADGLNYQWQCSLDGSNWNNIGVSQNTANYTVNSFTAANYYRSLTTCSVSGFSSASAPVYVNLNPRLNCIYCKPNYTLICANGDKITNFSISNLTNQLTNCDANGYSDSTGSVFSSIQLNAGAKYPLIANIANSGLGDKMIAGVWIDYNQNGTFEAKEYSYIGSGASGTYSTSISAPYNTASGEAKMRLKLEANYSNSLTTQDACNNNNYSTYGQIIDYKVVFTAAPSCSATPNAGSAISTKTAVCSNQNFTLDLTGNSISSGLTFQWQSSLDGSAWANKGSALQGPAFSIPSQTISTYYRCLVSCTSASLSSASNPILVSQNAATDCFCIPSTNGCDYTLISKINFVTLNDTIGCIGVNGYVDKTANTPVVLNANQTYTFNTIVKDGNYGNGFVGMWIDYNHNGIFDANEFNNIGSTNKYDFDTLNSSIKVPINALGGNARMRILFQSEYYTVPTLTSCSNNSFSGEYVDYIVNINAAPQCSATPNAGDAITSKSAVCKNDSYTLDLQNNDIVSGISYQWQSSLDGTSWANVGNSQGNIPLSITSQSNTTYYRCNATCLTSSLSSNSNSVAVNQNLPTDCFCIPSTSNCNNSFISKINFETLNDTIGCSGTNGYVDKTGVTPIVLNANQTYTFTTVVKDINYMGYAGMWIDFNQNGIFDTNEFTNIGSTNKYDFDTLNSFIKVPINALAGVSRMRFVIQSDYGVPTLAACSNNSFDGEYIDYFVNINAAPQCSATPNAGDAITSKTLVCKNEAFTLDLQNNSVVSGIAYQWQSSLDGTSWVNVGVAQGNTTFSIASQNKTSYYRCNSTCLTASLSSNSNPVVVNQNLAANCYCTPNETYSSSDYFLKINLESLNDSIGNANAFENRTAVAGINPINLTANQSYTLSTIIQNGYYGNGLTGIWIDFDQNGVFDDIEYTKIGLNKNANSLDTFLTSFSVPFTAIGGNTRIRFKHASDYNTVSNIYPCMQNSAYGQVVDYLVNINPVGPCSGTPTSGSAVSTSTAICPNSAFTLNLQGNEIASGIQYQWQQSTDNINWVNLGTDQNTVPFKILNQSTETNYRCISTCSASPSSTSTAVQVLQNASNICYCVPIASNNNYSRIDSVKFATLTYSSTTADAIDGYSDFTSTAPTITVTAGISYSVGLSTHQSYDNAGLWIDYDQNGIFDNEEFVEITPLNPYPNKNSAINILGSSISTSIIAIPNNAKTGTTRLRFRVASGYSVITQDNACNTLDDNESGPNGETEDYLITILPSSVTVTGNFDICPGQSTSLDLSPAITNTTGFTYQWKKYDGTGSSNIGTTSNTSDVVVTPTANTQYFCEILNNGSIILNSDTILVKVHVIATAVSSSSNLCYGACTASIALNASSNGETLSYTWTPNASDVTDAVSNLCAQDYTATISNTTGCILTQTVSIGQPSMMTATSTKTDVICYGAATGSADITVNGGSGVLTYSWIPTGGNTITATNLAADVYTVSVTDANNCAINHTLTITQPSITTVSVAGPTLVCEQTALNFTPTISGGVAPFTYAWTEMASTNVISTDSICKALALNVGNMSYYLGITDANSCVVNSNTISLTVNPSSNFSGTVTTYPNLPVAGRVILYKYESFYTKFDSVAGQNISSVGDFNFNSFKAGTYIIKAVPDNSNYQITYGDSAANWKTANHIIHTCLGNDTQNINIKALNTFTTSGSGTLSGKITEGDKYGKRLAKTSNITTPGGPIGGIIVKGGRNPGGQMFVQTVTDAITGTYTLTGLPANSAGEEYFILVDIPGLDTNGTYHLVINSINNQFTDLNFTVDSAKINPTNSTVSVHDISAIENQIKVFPNPASNKVTIQYNLVSNSNVQIDLYDIFGKSIKTILPLTLQNNIEHSYTVPLDDISSGMYFIKLKINNTISTVKLFISN